MTELVRQIEEALRNGLLAQGQHGEGHCYVRDGFPDHEMLLDGYFDISKIAEGIAAIVHVDQKSRNSDRNQVGTAD